MSSNLETFLILSEESRIRDERPVIQGKFYDRDQNTGCLLYNTAVLICGEEIARLIVINHNDTVDLICADYSQEFAKRGVTGADASTLNRIVWAHDDGYPADSILTVIDQYDIHGNLLEEEGQ